jgi:NAD(P)-dependent dehydrogenase (short-subunit alcohol dehydrogenase family)
MTWRGRTIWITGASSGIGAALAEAFAAEGAALVLSGRRQDALNALAARLGAETRVLPFEVTDRNALPGAVEAAWGWRDGIDLLVNNAGISQRSLALDTAPEVYDRILEVDLHAPIRLTQLLLPLMAARRTGTRSSPSPPTAWSTRVTSTAISSPPSPCASAAMGPSTPSASASRRPRAGTASAAPSGCSPPPAMKMRTLPNGSAASPRPCSLSFFST